MNKCIVAVVFASLAECSQVWAMLLAYEPFLTGGVMYATGNLEGQNPASFGFAASAAWNGPSGIDVAGTGLTFTDLNGNYTSTGGAARVDGTYSVDPGDVIFRRMFSPAVTNQLSSLNRVYFSFLERRSDLDGTKVAGLGISTSVTEYSKSAVLGQRLDGVQVKLLDNSGSSGGFMELNGGGTSTNGEAYTLHSGVAAGQWASNVTYLLIGRLDIDRIDPHVEKLSFWKYASGSPVPMTEESPFLVSQRNILKIEGSGMQSLQMVYNLAPTAGSAQFDEFRVGTTWEDIIVGIPEPTTSCLLLAFALTVGIRRLRTSNNVTDHR